jgi:hypothetical protein
MVEVGSIPIKTPITIPKGMMTVQNASVHETIYDTTAPNWRATVWNQSSDFSSGLEKESDEFHLDNHKGKSHIESRKTRGILCEQREVPPPILESDPHEFWVSIQGGLFEVIYLI